MNIPVLEDAMTMDSVKVMGEVSIESLREEERECAYTITRHDLLRVWICLGMGIGLET